MICPNYTISIPIDHQGDSNLQGVEKHAYKDIQITWDIRKFFGSDLVMIYTGY